MASAPLSGDPSAPSAPHRWPENNKVYTRKSHGKSAKLAAPVAPNSHQTLATATATADDLLSSLQEPPPETAPPPPEHRPISPVSDDEASSNHHHQHQPKGKRPLVKIAVAGKPPDERRQIRRRLASELDRVREAVKRLEARELQFSSGPAPAPSQLSVNVVAGNRALEEVLEVPATAPTPVSRKLSISVPPSVGGGDGGSVGDVLEKEKRTPKANQYYRSSEFILGKERIPPPESHSHKKSKGGKKQSVGESDRRSHGSDKLLLSDVFRSCKGLLGKLMKHKFAWVFNTPVDVKGLGLHDYYTIIKHPMDLGTVKSRLSKDWYSSPKEFAEDVRLTFRNAMTYNPKGQDVHIMAEQLSSLFEEQWPAIEGKYNNVLRAPQQVPRKSAAPVDMRKTFERADSGLQPMAVESTTPKQVNHTLPHIGRKTALAKPKAKDLDKREMTFEEKQKLSRQLQSLPPEKLDAIVMIIKKNNSNINQSDDEIEVDIDSMDTETLWELDRFVVNWKKSLSKHKRRLERAMEARALAQQHTQDTLQGRDPERVAAEVPNTNGTVGNQRNGATSPAHQGGNDDSRSSGSSSSSSDSGSSSSDSESDSSSDD